MGDDRTLKRMLDGRSCAEKRREKQGNDDWMTWRRLGIRDEEIEGIGGIR